VLIRNNQEVIEAYGHENVLATHKNTIEFTKEKNLSIKGNCIVAVSSNKSVSELSEEFKRRLRKKEATLIIIIEVDGLLDKIIAKGSSKLSLTNNKDMVIRKSEYICNRTLAIKANKAASDLSKQLIDKLRNPKKRVKITLLIPK
jgi:hypothetical protein